MAAGVPFDERLADLGVLMPEDGEVAASADAFVELVGRHRIHERFTGNAMLQVGQEPASAPAG
jgi:hypothetical protein